VWYANRAGVARFFDMLVFMPRPIPRPTDSPVVRDPRLDAMLQIVGVPNYSPDDSYWDKVKKNWVSNPLNPVPGISKALIEGRKPTGAEVGLDAGFLAAGLIPFGKAAGPAMRAIETAAAQQARRDAINFVPKAGLVLTGLGDAGRLSALVRRLNKSGSVEDFMTPNAISGYKRSNDSREGLYRPGAQSFDHTNVPEPASPYTFGLVPTEKLAPLREYDRWADPGTGAIGRGNVEKLIEHMAQGGKWSDPLSVAYYIRPKTGYLAEGNHRLALAEQLGLEQLPTQVWRQEYGSVPEGVGKYVGDLDTNQLAYDKYSSFPSLVGERYIPPTMHPYLLKYFQPGQ